MEGMIVDCRKLGRERVPKAYLVVFLHPFAPNWFNPQRVVTSFDRCQTEWTTRFDGPSDHALDRLQLLVVAELQCYRRGAWSADFPGVTV